MLVWTRDLLPSQRIRKPDAVPSQLLQTSARGGETPTVILEDADRWIVDVRYGKAGISGCMDALNVPGRAFFIRREDDGTLARAQTFELAGLPEWGTRHLYCGEVRDTEDGDLFVNVTRQNDDEGDVWVRFSHDPSVDPSIGVEPPPRTGWSLENGEVARYTEGRRDVLATYAKWQARGELLEDGDGAFLGLNATAGSSKTKRCYDGRLVRITATGTRDIAEGQCSPIAIAAAGSRVYWLDDVQLISLDGWRVRLKSVELGR